MGGKRDNGNCAGLRRGLDPARSLPAVEHRQAQIHKNEIGPFGCRHGDALRAVGGDHDRVAGARQPAFQHVDVVVVILDVENLHAGLAVRGLTHLPSSAVKRRSISSRSLFSIMRSTPPLSRLRSASVKSLAVMATTEMPRQYDRGPS